MASKLEIKLDGRVEKQIRGRIDRFSFEVGVLEDGPHKLALSANRARKQGWKKNNALKPSAALALGGLKSFAGGPARKVGTKSSGLTISQVSERLRKESGVNFYSKPWKSRQNADLLKVIRSFMKLLSLKGVIQEKKRLENALQAVVRNPILRGEYGSNSSATAKRKGFNRFMIDTAQLFKAIKAKVRIRSV